MKKLSLLDKIGGSYDTDGSQLYAVRNDMIQTQ